MSSKKADAPSFWFTKAYDDRLATGEGILGVGTECYGPVKGEIILLNSVNNNFNTSQFDHIVEGGIKVESGQLEVLDCPNLKVELKIKVKPGIYRVRIYSSNLGV